MRRSEAEALRRVADASKAYRDAYDKGNAANESLTRNLLFHAVYDLDLERETAAKRAARKAEQEGQPT